MTPRPPYQSQWQHQQHHILPNQRYLQPCPYFVSSYHNPYHGSPSYPAATTATANTYNMTEERPNKKVKVEPKAQAPVPGKGLRHFSMKICERVKSMGSTSYNEVADLLIKELREDEAKAHAATTVAAADSKKKRNKPPQSKYDEKNIRRRVYDALNVLMAMDIIVKDKKMIVWNGLPGERTLKPPPAAAVAAPKEINRPSERLLKLKEERSRRQAEVQRKREVLQELITQNVCFNNLYKRNMAMEAADVQSVKKKSEEEKIPLPFVVVNTSHSTVIQCEMCPKKTNVNFDFTSPFEINDDNEILKRLGLNKIEGGELSKLLPPDIMRYCESRGILIGGVGSEYGRA